MTRLARNLRQIGQTIRETRKQKGLSQQELGKLAGFQQETISRIETGKSSMKLQTILVILAVLDLEFRISPRTQVSFQLSKDNTNEV